MSRPFDEARYKGLLEGLEVAEIPLSALERTKRVDAEYFQPKHLCIEKILTTRPGLPITEVAAISDGNHFSISEEFADEGVPYYRGQDVVGHFFIEQASPVFITEKAYRVSHMVRSHLKRGDVLLSIVGTVGETSLVASDAPATCSCKLAILRPHDIAPEYLAVYLQTAHGRSQIERLTRGAVQMGLLLEDMDQIKVARLSSTFEQQIAQAVLDARQGLEGAQEYMQQAEQTLLRALGLENWQLPEPLTYTRRASDAFAAGRLDAEHFQESYYALANVLREYQHGCLQLGEICPNPVNGVEIREYEEEGTPYLRVGDVKNFTVDLNTVKRVSPSAAEREISKVALRVGDVLVSRSGSLAVTGVVEQEWAHTVISSHLIRVRLEDASFDPYYVAAFLSALPGRMQIEQRSNGGVQPEINQPSLKSVLIPRLELLHQNKIRNCIFLGHTARRQAHALLEAAKRAVEIAIEDSEAAALAYLEPFSQP